MSRRSLPIHVDAPAAAPTAAHPGQGVGPDAQAAREWVYQVVGPAQGSHLVTGELETPPHRLQDQRGLAVTARRPTGRGPRSCQAATPAWIRK